MQSANCAECARLLNESAALLWRYNAARDALALAESFDQAHAERRKVLTSVSERLDEALTLQYVHEKSHDLVLVLRRHPERRVSLTADRRRIPRGGRRLPDRPWPSPMVIPCPKCQTGLPGLLVPTTEDARSTATYRCRTCGHQINRVAEG